jgi:hypothetical protein
VNRAESVIKSCEAYRHHILPSINSSSQYHCNASTVSHHHILPHCCPNFDLDLKKGRKINMRFLNIALAIIACGLSMSQAKQFTSKELNDMLDAGLIDQELLLKHAVPLSKVRRRLQNNYNYNNNNGNSNAYYNSNYNNNGNNANYNNGNNANYNNGNNANYNNGNNANYNNGNNGNSNNGNSNNGNNGNYNNGNYGNNANYNNANNANDDNSNYNDNNADDDNNANDANDAYYSDNGYYNNGANYDWDEDGDYKLPINSNTTVRFNQCMSFAVEDEGILEDGTLLQYAQSGVITAQQSYVIFDVETCVPGNCVFDEGNLEKVYMVPIEIFLTSMVDYYPSKRQSYCQACTNFYSYCTEGNGRYYDT